MPGSALKRWNWLESGLIPLAAVVMRVAWITPLLHVVLNHPIVEPKGTVLPAWMIATLLLAAIFLARAPQERVWGRWPIIGMGLLAILLVLGNVFPLSANDPMDWVWKMVLKLTDLREGLPPALIVAVTGAAIWRRGMLLSWRDYEETRHGFLNGVVVLGFLMLASSMKMGGTQGLDLWGASVVFTLAGLLALALVSVVETWALEGTRSTKAPLTPYWLLALGGLVLLILFGGWLLGTVLSPDTVQHALRLLSPIVHLIGVLLDYVLIAIAYVVMWFLEPLFRILQGQMTQQEPAASGALKRLLQEPPQQLEGALGPSAALLNALRILFVLGLAFGILTAFALAMRRHAHKQDNDIIEEREHILSLKLLRDQLRGLFQGRHADEGSPFLALDQPQDPRQVVRALYQHLLGAALALGRPRPRSVTPSAYRGLLESLMPEERQAIRTLTDAYQVARYAGDPPAPAQVDAARQALVQIEATLTEKGNV
jgi:hypothetical protein